jgi:hypothetical protein
VSQQPIFLLSLPRSGSTLVQRILASHPEISTAPEPWVLLPLVFAMRESGAWARYGHAPAARAIREFAARLPNGDQDYVAELRRFVLALYGRASENPARYFLDKTPRYHFIAQELRRIFPDARLVFLWRNPLSVAASIVATWGDGKWRPDRWRVDLLEGPRNLVAAYEREAEDACAVRYEDLVRDPLGEWPRVFGYLGLEFDPSFLERLPSVQLSARMGDRTGSDRYRHLSTEPLEKWRAELASPLRKRWCRAYLRRIGDRALGVMGYDLGSLLSELDALPSDGRRVLPDAANGTYSWSIGAGRRVATRFLAPRRTLWSARWPADTKSAGQGGLSPT